MNTDTPRKKTPPCLFAAAALAIFATGFTSAQTAPASDSQADQPAESTSLQAVKLNPFVISESQSSPWNSAQTFSGSRVAENLLDIPISMSIISGDFINTIGATKLTDVLNYAASGVNMRVSYRDDISIRGFRETVSRDGVEQETSYIWPGLYDVDRIEIVKGPAALIYGDFGDIGGVVNYVTKRPTETFQGDGEVVVGTDKLYIADFTQRGPLTRDGSVRYRVTLGMQKYGGYKDGDYNNNALASFSVDWTVNRKLLVQTDFSHGIQASGDFNYSIADPVSGKLLNDLLGLPATFSTSAPWAKVSQTNDHFRINVIYQPTENISLRILQNDFDNRYTQFVPTPDNLHASQYPNYTTIAQEFLYFLRTARSEDLQADISWKAEWGRVGNRLTGGWAQSFQGEDTDLALAPLPDIVIAAPFSQRPLAPDISTWHWYIRDRQYRDTYWTAYVQDQVSLLNNHLLLSAGVRHVDKSAVNTPPIGSKEVPRYGIVYKVNDGISLYAAYADSFTPVTPGYDILGNRIRNAIGKDVEGGLKFNMLGGRLFGSVDYFDIANDPVLLQTQITDPTTGLVIKGAVDTGKQTNKGLEADLGTSLAVGPGQLLSYVTICNSNPLNQQGQRPSRVVADKYSVFVKYDFASGALKNFYLGGGLSYFGSEIGTGIAIEPAYTMSSAVFGYQGKKWGVKVNLDNLADKKNIIIGSEAGVNVYTAAPFSAKIAVTMKW